MKTFVILLLMAVFVYGDKPVALQEKFSKSDNCVTCHAPIVKDWKKSWHSKSHFSSDEYFKKTIKHMARKMRSKNEDTLQVECATCHNPRIAITKTTADDEIAAVMGLSTKVKDAVNSAELSEGINCVVCHNIDKIHSNKDEAVRGIHLVKWMPSGVMSGPFSDAKSPYHKTKKRDFMSANPNKLCFVCHANNRSVKGVVFANTFEEYGKSKDAPLCVDCHMGKLEKGVASTLAVNGKTKQRKVRKHGFAGAHSPKLIKGALELNLKRSKDKLRITLYNPNPHNVPTGYGSREIIIDVKYIGKEKYKEQSLSLTSSFLDRRNKPTVAHSAKKIVKNEFVPAQGKKVYMINIPKGAKKVSVKVWYRLVNEDIVTLLKLEEERWSERMLITKKIFKL